MLKFHPSFCSVLEQEKDGFEAMVMEQLWMNGAYWSLTMLDLLHKLKVVDADEVVSCAMGCHHEECRGFGGNVGHDLHLLYTLSPVQILELLDQLDALDFDKL